MNESYPEPSEAQVLAWIGEHYGSEAKGPVSELEMAVARRAAAWAFQEYEAKYRRSGFKLIQPTP